MTLEGLLWTFLAYETAGLFLVTAIACYKDTKSKGVAIAAGLIVVFGWMPATIHSMIRPSNKAKNEPGE